MPAVAAVVLGYLREPREVGFLVIAAAYAAAFVLPWSVDAIHLKRSVRWNAEAPDYTLDVESRQYHPTWKGTILMSCKLRSPIRLIARTLRRRAGVRMLRELELGYLASGKSDPDRARDFV